MNSKQVAIIIILSAISVGTNYAMISIFNVKLMDFVVFVGGFCFGPFVGVSIGMVSWGIYGSLNPMGFSLLIWFSTMLSESIYGIAGSLTRKMLNSGSQLKNGQLSTYFFFGATGMLLTFAYDILTNIVWGYQNGPSIFGAIIFGVPFSIVHALSNAFFFGLGCTPAINAVLKVVGSGSLGVHKK
jgi:LytS/YehU family sensor histidine kinase